MASVKPTGHIGPQRSSHSQTTLHRLSKPRYLVCKTSLPFFLMQTEHYTQLLSQTADAYRHCIMPGRVLSAQRQPQGDLGHPRAWHWGVPRAGGGELELAGSWSFGGGNIPRTEIIPGKNKTTETQCAPPHDVGWEILTFSEAFSHHAHLCPRE